MWMAKRMMPWLWTASYSIDTNEQWEINDPYITVWAFMNGWTSNVITQLSKNFTGGIPFVGDDQYEVAWHRTKTVTKRSALGCRNELCYRRLKCLTLGNAQPH